MPGGLCGEEEKQGLLCLPECETPPSSQPASCLSYCPCRLKKPFFPPENTLLLSKHTSLHPPFFLLEKLLLGIVCRVEFYQGSRGENSCTVITWCGPQGCEF